MVSLLHHHPPRTPSKDRQTRPPFSSKKSSGYLTRRDCLQIQHPLRQRPLHPLRTRRTPSTRQKPGQMMNINRPTIGTLRQHRRINQQRQTIQPPTPHHPTHARPQPPGTLSEHTQLATMNPPTHPTLATTIPKSHHPPHTKRITPIQQQRGDLLHIHQRTPLTDHNPGWYAPANPLTPPLRAKRC